MSEVLYMTSRLGHRGLTLIEVLMSVTIMSIVLVALLATLNYVIDGQAQDKFLKQMENLHEEVRAHLSSPGNCLGTFAGMSGVGVADVPMTAVKDAAGANVYAVSSSFGDGSVVLNSVSFNPTTPAGGANPSRGILKFIYKRNPIGLGPQEYVRTIEIHVQRNAADVFTGCIALAKMTDGIWRRSLANQNWIFYSPGRVGIGTTNPNAYLHIVGESDPPLATHFQIESENSWPLMRLVGTGMRHPVFDFMRFRPAGGFAVTNDFLGQLTYRTRGAAIGAEIVAIAAENHSFAVAGTSLNFRTSVNGTNTPQTRMQITGTGDVRFMTNLVPSADINHDFGDAGHRWRQIHAQNIFVTNPVSVTSDARAKKDVQETDLGLGFINSLRPVSYTLKEGDGRPHYGFIAQEVKGALVEAQGRGTGAIIHYDPKTDRYSLDYTDLIAPLTKAVQELSRENAELRQRLERIEKSLIH